MPSTKLTTSKPGATNIGRGSFAWDRPNLRVADYSGFKRLGAALIGKYKKEKRRDDFKEGQRLGTNPLMRDEAGNIVTNPAYESWSYEKQQGYDQTHGNQVDYTIKNDLNRQWTEIAMDTEAYPDNPSRLAAMRAAGDAVVASIDDPVLRQEYEAWYLNQLSQRANNYANQDLALERRRAIGDNTAIIEQRLTDVRDTAVAGGNPADELNDIDDAADALYDLGQISEIERDQMKKSARQGAYMQGIEGQLVQQIFKGEYSAEQLVQLNAWADQLVLGGDATFEKNRVAKEVFDLDQENYGLGTETMNTTEVRDYIEDEALVGNMAKTIKGAISSYSTAAKAIEQDRAFMVHFGNLGPFEQIASEYKDDFEDRMITPAIKQGAINDPAGQDTIAMLVGQSKYMPPQVLNELMFRVRSGDPRQIIDAVMQWKKINAYSDPAGNNAGGMVRLTMSESDLNTLDGMADAVDIIGNDPEGIKLYLQRKDRPEYSISSAIDKFNENKGDGETFVMTMTQSFADAFDTDFGVLPNGYKDTFERAFQAAYVGTNDADLAFQKATERMHMLYDQTPYSSTKVGRVGDVSLKNPAGYTGRYDFGPKGPGSPTVDYGDHHWLTHWTRDTLLELNQQGRLDIVDEGQFARDINQHNFLGTRKDAGGIERDDQVIWLEPLGGITGDSGMPQYEVWYRDPNGEKRPMMGQLPNGSVAPLILDPGFHRNRLQSIHEGKEHLKSIQGISKTKLDESNAAIWRTMQRDPLIGPYLPFEQPETLEEMQQYADRNPAVAGKVAKAIEDRQRFIDGANKFLNEEAERINGLIQNGPKSNFDYDTPVSEGGIELPVHNMSYTVDELHTQNLGGTDATASAVIAIEQVLPDGTGGNFMWNIAAVESDAGTAGGTYRNRIGADTGPWQINTSSQGAFNEVKRRVRTTKRFADAAQLLKRELNVDVANATYEDLNKPIVNAAFARMYLMTIPVSNPSDPVEQAAVWKKWYNTVEGAGKIEDFVQKASGRTFFGPRPTVGNATRGVVIGTDGTKNPKNFRELNKTTQTRTLQLSDAFGEKLRITPHGGKRHRGSKTSQHYHGNATDIYVADYSNSKKTKLIALAIANGARGIGGYGAGDGLGTLHFDYRNKQGNGPEGLGVWWRHRPGEDASWTTAPQWFQKGILLGLEMRRSKGRSA